ncbi:hypothetical protein GEMRC1_014214 [Eukaryota sp. GEM-RC1]
MTSSYSGPSYDHFKLTTIPLPYIDNVAVENRYDDQVILPDESLIDPELVDFDLNTAVFTELPRKRRQKTRISGIEDELMPYEKLPRTSSDDTSMKLPTILSDGSTHFLPQDPSPTSLPTTTSLSQDQDDADLDPNDPEFIQRKLRQGKQIVSHLLSTAFSSEDLPLHQITQLITLSNPLPTAKWTRNPKNAKSQDQKEFVFDLPKTCNVIPTIRKLAIASATQVLIDVLPDYRIRELSDKEKKVDSLSKDVKKQRDNDNNLLKYYSNYITNLDDVISQGKSKECDTELLITAISSVKSLLVARPEFNFSNRLISVLIKCCTIAFNRALGADLQETARDIASEGLRMIMTDDAMSHVSLVIASAVNKLTKKSISNLSPQLIAVFEHLPLSDIVDTALQTSQDEEKTMTTAKMRRKKDKLLKRQPKHMKQARKQNKVVEKELSKVNADKNVVRKRALKTQILQSIFAIFLRILRNTDDNAMRLRPIALRGVAHFAHHLSVDLLLSILDTLKVFISDSSTDLETALHAATVVIVSLKGPAEAINFEFTEFHSCLYERLLDLMYPENFKFTELFIRVLSEVLSQKKKISHQKAAAFFKRLVSVGSQLPPSASLLMMLQAKKLLMTYPSLSALTSVDSEDVVSGGLFLYTASNPDHANAMSATVNEFAITSAHYHPSIRQCVDLIGKNTSNVPDLINADLVIDPTVSFKNVKGRKFEKVAELPQIFIEELPEDLALSLRTLQKFI